MGDDKKDPGGRASDWIGPSNPSVDTASVDAEAAKQRMERERADAQRVEEMAQKAGLRVGEINAAVVPRARTLWIALAVGCVFAVVWCLRSPASAADVLRDVDRTLRSVHGGGR